MDVVHLPSSGADVVEPSPCAVTIGAYDGVHMGHRAVIAEVRSRAARLDLPTTVVTFDRHPAMVVRPESAPLLLTDLDQKLELLAGTGVERVAVIRFDLERAAEVADDFVRDVLVGGVGARLVVVGEDFHFGNQRQGDVALLRKLGAQLGFETVGLDLVGVDGRPAGNSERVSSTAIRHHLRSGDLARANAWLGRPHEVRGVVSPGDQRGRTLGFPTANVAVPGDILMPADGIYAGWYERPDGSVHATAMSLGRRPTFYQQSHASLLECFLIDWSGDLYGEVARVRFTHRLRGERRFNSVEALVEQMRLDVENARRLLAA